MDQNNLYQVIAAYQPRCVQEERDRQVMLDFLRSYDNTLDRENLLGHFTVSCWILNPRHDRALMVFHNIFRAWSWVGGHADGEGDLLAVALKEAREETGLEELFPLQREPASLELIAVQAHERKGQYVGPHLHLNLTYLFEASEDVPLRIQPQENSAVAWRDLTEILSDHTEPHMLRLYEKLIERYSPVK